MKNTTKFEKFILDACCGGKMFWYDKNHPNVKFVDIRDRDKGCLRQRPNFEVKPDEIQDFRKLKYSDGSFKLVVWDPPHTIRTGDPENGIVAIRYGRLNPKTWKDDLTKGFNECYRVLEDYGILIFKWADESVKIKDVLELFPVKPLFGNRPGTKIKTHWLCFMKLPK